MNLSISNSKVTLILKVGVLILLFVLMEYGIDAYLDKNNKNPSFRLGKSILKQIKEKHIESAQLIVVGDSSCNAGIDTGILKKITGYETFKLAPPARYAQMSGYYFLKEYLQYNPPPKILLDIRTPSLMSRNWSPDLFFDNFFNISDTIQMVRMEIIDFNNFFLYIPNIVSSYRNRYALKRLIGEKFRWLNYYTLPMFENELNKKKNRKSIRPQSRQVKQRMDSYIKVTKRYSQVFLKHLNAKNHWIEGTESEQGKLIVQKKISEQRRLFKIGKKNYMLSDIQYTNGLKPFRVANSYFGRLRLFYQVVTNNERIVTQVDQFYLQKMKELCEKNNIRFFFCPGPLFEGLYNHEIGKEFFDKALSEFQEIAELSPRSYLLMDEMLLFPFEMFTNSTEHLNSEGMKLYSQKVAEALNAALYH